MQVTKKLVEFYMFNILTLYSRSLNNTKIKFNLLIYNTLITITVKKKYISKIYCNWFELMARVVCDN